MNYSIYTIYDTVAKVHYAPFYQSNDEQAIRTFQSMALDKNVPIHGNPGDFDLLHIGYYDSDTGVLEGNIRELVLRGAHVPETKKPLKAVGDN